MRDKFNFLSLVIVVVIIIVFIYVLEGPCIALNACIIDNIFVIIPYSPMYFI